MSLSAIAGLLAFPAIPGYFPFVIFPLIFSVLAYRSYGQESWKRTFIVVAALNFVVGNGLYFTPHADNDGLGVLGLLIAFLIFVPSLIARLRIYQLEMLDSSD